MHEPAEGTTAQRGSWIDDGTDPTWFIVFSRPRQERRAKDNLERQDFACSLPEVRNTRSARIEPLFPRYLFLQAVPGEQSLDPVRSTRGVSRLVRFGEKLATLSGDVIRAIGERIDPETGLVRIPDLELRSGDRVRLFQGPLAGTEAIFKARSGKERVLLLMDLLGRQTTVEVDALSLRRAL